jgi:hypothetical protein
LEVSFLDRSDEEKRLQKEDYLEAIAAAIAKGIEDHTGTAQTTSVSESVETGDAIETEALETLGRADAVVELLDLETVTASKA